MKEEILELLKKRPMTAREVFKCIKKGSYHSVRYRLKKMVEHGEILSKSWATGDITEKLYGWPTGYIKPASKRGFASMDPEKLAEITSLGGKAAQRKGVGHRFTSEEARAAGRIGGSRRQKAF